MNCTDCPTGTLTEPGSTINAPFTGFGLLLPPPPQAASANNPATAAVNNPKCRTRFTISNLPFVLKRISNSGVQLCVG